MYRGTYGNTVHQSCSCIDAAKYLKNKPIVKEGSFLFLLISQLARWWISQIPTLELPYGGQFWGWAILSTSVIRIAHLNYKVLLCNVCAVYCFHVSANQLDCVSQIFRPTSKQRKTTAMISQVIYSLCSGLNRNTPSVSGRDIWESCDVEGRPTPGSGNQAWGTCGPTPGWGTDTWAAGTAWSWR